MNSTEYNKLKSLLEIDNCIQEGQLIGESIDIMRNYPYDPISKKTIVHLGTLDGLDINSSCQDPVKEYIEFFGVNTSWDKFNGKAHIHM